MSVLPRIRVQAGKPPYELVMSRLWINDHEVVGAIDISVSMDRNDGQVISFRLAASSVEWHTEPTVEFEFDDGKEHHRYRGVELP